MKSKFDYYQKADELISELIAAGFNEYAHALRDSIVGGSTGTEIFMALKWNLERLLDDSKCEGQMQLNAQQLKDAIEEALG